MKRSQKLEVLRDEAAGVALERPRTRGDCESGPRPCPWLACRHHLAVEVGEDGRIYVPGRRVLSRDATDRELEAFTDAALVRAMAVGSCSLDHARRHGEQTLEKVSVVLDVTRERIRQIESKAKRRLRRKVERRIGVKAGESLGFDPEAGFDQ